MHDYDREVGSHHYLYLITYRDYKFLSSGKLYEF